MLPKGISLPGEESWLQVRSNAKKKLCWIPPWNSNKESPLLCTLIDGPQPSPVPASYPLFFLWIKSTESLSLLSSPSLSWAWSHVHILHNWPRQMSKEQKQRASVGQSRAINRLFEFIIVSSYDGEEPGGLGEREEGRPSSITLCWLLFPFPRIQILYQFHLSWFSSFVGRCLSHAGNDNIHVLFCFLLNDKTKWGIKCCRMHEIVPQSLILVNSRVTL